jgi:hypothetical protein
VYSNLKTSGVFAGSGREFEKLRNLWVLRAGIEVEFEINGYRDISPSVVYDLKGSVYDSWTLGLTVGKRFYFK